MNQKEIHNNCRVMVLHLLLLLNPASGEGSRAVASANLFRDKITMSRRTTMTTSQRMMVPSSHYNMFDGASPYRDDTYSTPATATATAFQDYDWLGNGRGKLTDGYKELTTTTAAIPLSSFFNDTNDNDGQQHPYYVGWKTNESLPSISFYFARETSINDVRISVHDSFRDDDNQLYCGPASVVIGGTTHAFPPNENPNGGPYEAVIELDPPLLISRQVRITVMPRCEWVLLSEIAFYATDGDRDGVPDGVDRCPVGTVADTGDVAGEEGRFVYDGSGGGASFVTNDGSGGVVASGSYSIDNVMGCSCEQIVNATGPCAEEDCVTKGCHADKLNEWIVLAMTSDAVAVTAVPSSAETSLLIFYPTDDRGTDGPTYLLSEIPSTTYPTKIPSTWYPTVIPSKGPTITRSTSPSFAKTHLPTSYPTPTPGTDSPSSHPSESPSTQHPTSIPTNLPTVAPTNSPTTYPTVTRTHSPSFAKTHPPTLNPTNTRSTDSPSSHPTTIPTGIPTVKPTNYPTARPTLRPTTGQTTTVPTAEFTTSFSEVTTVFSDFLSPVPTTVPTTILPTVTKYTNPPTESHKTTSIPTAQFTTEFTSITTTSTAFPSVFATLTQYPSFAFSGYYSTDVTTATTTNAPTPTPTPPPLPCQKWCPLHENPWTEKCKWKKNCAGCDQCLSPPTIAPTIIPTTTPSSSLPCLQWCDTHEKPWTEKCRWKKKCAGCDECREGTTTDKHDNKSPPVSDAQDEPRACATWCPLHPEQWEDKCAWNDHCGGCDECLLLDTTNRDDYDDDEMNKNGNGAASKTMAPSPTPPSSLPCKYWCATHESAWERKCKWKENCAGCAACRRSPTTDDSSLTDDNSGVQNRASSPTVPKPPCQKWCAPNEKNWKTKCQWINTCAGCDACFSKDDTNNRRGDKAALPATRRQPTSSPTTRRPCKYWCENHESSWERKCTWKKNCAGCSACRRRRPRRRGTTADDDSPVVVNGNENGGAAGKEKSSSPTVPMPPCKSWCATHEKKWEEKCQWVINCAGCEECFH